MSANFWLSSHCTRWILDEDALSHSNAVDKEYFSIYEVDLLRYYYVNVIQALVKRLKLRQRVAATAIIYFRRYYVGRNFVTSDPRLMTACCVYAAAKAEECQSPNFAKSIVNLCKQRDPYYPFMVDDIFEGELFLLEEMEFYLLVFHPYRSLKIYINDANLGDCLQIAWEIVNDSYRTDIGLLYPPYMTALAAMHMAAVYAGKNIGRVETWFKDLNVDMGEIEKITQKLILMYNTLNQTSLEQMEATNAKLMQTIQMIKEEGVKVAQEAAEQM